jgi:uncharacterized protein (DUF302 family)
MPLQTGAAEGLEVSLSAPFDQVIDRVKTAFKTEGFGALSEIDVRKALKEKIGAEIESYTILGMCNPNLASRAIAAEHEIGLLLPCNVLVHECGGQVRVKAQDPISMMEMAKNDALRPIAEEADQRIRRALEQLQGGRSG